MKWKTSDGGTVEMSLKERILYVKPQMEKSFEASKMPIVYLVVLAILNLTGSILVRMDAFTNLAILLELAIFFWAGYSAVNKFKLDRDNALRTGLITGFIVSWINVPLSFIVIDSGRVKGAPPIPGSIFDYLLDILMASVVMAVWGGIIAAIGGYIALKRKPKEKSTKKKSKQA